MKDTLGAFVPGGAIRVEGAAEGALQGLDFAAKDIFDIAGRVTGCGNPDWARTHGPAAAAAPSVRAWLDAGATLVGKTVTDELAFSLNGQNFHYGTPTNVNAPGRIPGGSSCGSASAVAGGLADLALGSDTGGSVRIPASYCGLYGIRPSHGRITLDGVMPLAPSFDTVGWFARDPETLRRAGEVLLGQTAGQTAGEAGGEATGETAPPPTGLLIAEDAFALVAPETRRALAPALARLEARLGRGRPVTLGHPDGGLAHWTPGCRHLLAREIWHHHGDWITETRPRFGPETAERFAWVQTVREEEAEAARPVREALAARMDDLLADGAVICLPTAPGIAPRLDADADTLRAHRKPIWALTFVAALARLPQITLPLASHAGCPLGLSLMGARGSDMTLLAFAEALAAEPAEPAIRRN